MSELNKFIKTANSLIELIAHFNDFDSNSYTEDTLEIHSEEITKFWAHRLLLPIRWLVLKMGYIGSQDLVPPI